MSAGTQKRNLENFLKPRQHIQTSHSIDMGASVSVHQQGSLAAQKKRLCTQVNRHQQALRFPTKSAPRFSTTVFKTPNANFNFDDTQYAGNLLNSTNNKKICANPDNPIAKLTDKDLLLYNPNYLKYLERLKKKSGGRSELSSILNERNQSREPAKKK